MFVTCQNLHFGKYVRWSCLSVCYLPKFNFGKYVRWSCLSVCLSVCYLPKFDFGKYVRWSCLSVCLLLAKINILASMFVGRVCLLLAKIYILASMFVGRVCLFVCLSVCLFVRKFHKISRTTQSIITKLGHKQALVHDSCKFVGQECRSNN